MSLLALLPAIALAPRPMPFMLSVQAWTFHRFTTFEAIDRTARTGAKYIELFPGQTLRAGSDIKIGPDMGETALNELRQKLQSAGVKAVAFGVTGIDRNPANADKLFVWAKSVGIQIINTESADAVDTIEAMVRKHDLRVGFHNHPRRMDDPGYRMWDPNYVKSLIEGRDRRIGFCADTGHWVRSGIKPVDALKIAGDRVVSSHLKDLSKFSPDGHDVPWATGVSDVPGILTHYEKIKMRGTVSVEYEFLWDDNVPEVGQCVSFVRGWFAR
jgi:sugar phosphate isomerase/epimerase